MTADFSVFLFDGEPNYLKSYELIFNELFREMLTMVQGADEGVPEAHAGLPKIIKQPF